MTKDASEQSLVLSGTARTGAAKLTESPPIIKRCTRSGAQDVYESLRRDILNGRLRPGDVLNQVHIAKQFGVSRTPVREAMRMLQSEGLAEAQFQHRIRVTPVTPQEVDTVYAMWILLDALAVSLTVPRLQAHELEEIQEALHDMNAASPSRRGPNDDWPTLHNAFHRLLIRHAGLDLAQAIEGCRVASERARRTYRLTGLESWLASEAEHTGAVDAYARGAVEEARYILSGQLSRIALTVIGNIDPSYEPIAIRQALQLVVQQGTIAANVWAMPLPRKASLAEPRGKVRGTSASGSS